MAGQFGYSERSSSYHPCRELYPPTLTRGGPTNAVRSLRERRNASVFLTATRQSSPSLLGSSHGCNPAGLGGITCQECRGFPTLSAEVPRSREGKEMMLTRWLRFPLGAVAAIGAIALAPAALANTGISFQSASSAHNTITASLALPVPNGVASGDVFIAAVDVIQAPNITAPSGWILVRTDTIPNGNQLRQAIYYHLASSPEPSSYTWNFSAPHGATGGIITYRGVDPTSPVATSGGQLDTNTTQITAPSIMTATANEELVGVFGVGGNHPTTPPGNMTQRFADAQPNTPGEKVTSGAADQLLTTNGASGSRTATANLISTGIGQLVALRPVTTTGTVTEYSLPIKATPSGIAKGPDGNLWFSLEQSKSVGRLTPSGVFTLYPLPTSGNLGGITAGPDGNVWFTEYTANKIAKITPTGVITEYTLPSSSGVAGITAGSDGNLWFAESAANRIGRITTSGVITIFNVPTASAFPHGINLGTDGNVWFAEMNASKVARIAPNGVITEFTLPTPSANPDVINAGPDGNMWFTEDIGKIGRITTSGVTTEFPLSNGAAWPVGITAGPDGNIWFTEKTANRIGRITPNGVITEFPVPTASSQPDKIAAGPDGNLWFTEHNRSKIARITP
jgi:streptogramin lyase